VKAAEGGTHRFRTAWLPVFFLLAAGTGCLAPAETLPASGEPLRASGEPLLIHFLDVGQGDAVLIEGPTGERVLIDTGPGQGVVDALARLGVDSLDLMILSHNHADHIGGATAVLNAIPVRHVMENGVPHTTVTYRTLLATLIELDIPVLEPERRTISLGAATLEILPPPGDESLGHNDNSIGVLLRHGAFSATFAGDAERALWEHWIEEFPDLIVPVQLHKASHHGSRNGDTPEALALLVPELVVVSASAGNSYGHPHPEALQRYQAVDAEVLLTSEEGTISILAFQAGRWERLRSSRATAPIASPLTLADPLEGSGLHPGL